MVVIDLTNLSKNIDFISVEINGKIVRIPNFISMGSVIEYEKEYESTKDVRMSFCRLLSEMAKYDNEQKTDIDFSKLKDEELIDIMKFILKDDDYYGIYLKENNYEYTFDNFYKAYDFKRKEISDKLRIAFEPLIKFNTNLVGHFDTLSKFKAPPLGNTTHSHKDFNFTPRLSYRNISDNLIENVSEESVIEDIIDKKPIQDATVYWEEGLAILKGQFTIMKEEKEAKEKSEKDSLRRDIVNFGIAIISLIISALSFIGLDNIANFFKNK